MRGDLEAGSDKSVQYPLSVGLIHPAQVEKLKDYFSSISTECKALL